MRKNKKRAVLVAAVMLLALAGCKNPFEGEAVPTYGPTRTPVPTGTATPLPTYTSVPKTPTDTPVPTSTPKPTDTATPIPTSTEAPQPAVTDTPVPTDMPAVTPSDTPEPSTKAEKLNIFTRTKEPIQEIWEDEDGAVVCSYLDADGSYFTVTSYSMNRYDGSDMIHYAGIFPTTKLITDCYVLDANNGQPITEKLLSAGTGVQVLGISVCSDGSVYYYIYYGINGDPVKLEGLVPIDAVNGMCAEDQHVFFYDYETDSVECVICGDRIEFSMHCDHEPTCAEGTEPEELVPLYAECPFCGESYLDSCVVKFHCAYCDKDELYCAMFDDDKMWWKDLVTEEEAAIALGHYSGECMK